MDHRFAVVSTVLLVVLFGVTYGLPPLLGCPGCARLEGESCGGLWEIYGQCAEGLVCQQKERKFGENKELSRAFGQGICERKEETCRPNRCKMLCRYGFEKDENGCSKCVCRKCPPILCKKHCPFGFKKEMNGCSTCVCNGPPKKRGPSIRCKKHCPFGFKKEMNGCPTCVCIDPPPTQCPPLISSSSPCKLQRWKCPFDYKKDKNGCDTCACNAPPHCAIQDCYMDCHHGVRTDWNGCPICVCAMPTDCHPKIDAINCKKGCPHGFKKDHNGCEVCVCAE